MLYQYKPVPDDPQRDRLPWGFRLRVISGTRQGHLVQAKDSRGEPVGQVSIRSLEPLR